MSDVNSPARYDALWTIATAGLSAVLQLLQLMIAARYLDARAFGALALVNVAVFVILAFQDLGLSSFCVHLGATSRRSQSTLFWLSAALGLAGSLLVTALAYPLARFYALPELAFLLPLVGLNFLLIGLGAQYQANLVRTFRARRLAQIELVARLCGFAVCVALLVGHRGVVAVVVGLIVFAAIKLLLMGCVADRDWHPRREFDPALAPRALRYGANQAASQLVNQLRMQADQLILGRALGPELLGVYSLAKELISYPQRFMQPLFARLTLPVLARDQHAPLLLRAGLVRSLKYTAVAGAIVYGLVAWTAPWIVEILYGGRFIAVAQLIPWLAVFGALRPLGMPAGMLAQATGQTAVELRWNLVSALVTAPAMLLVALLWPSLTAFAIAASALQIVLTLLAYPCFVRALAPVGVGAYFRTWVPSFAAIVVLAGLALWLPLPRLAELGWSPHQLWDRVKAIAVTTG